MPRSDREQPVPAAPEPALPPREDHEFLSSGTRCAAWLYRPGQGTTNPPLVILAHGLGGTRHMRLGEYAERFAAAGMAALVFDYRGFGDSDGSPRQVVDIRQQLDDWHAALAYARAGVDGIDRSRIAIWGTSFGGGHVMQIAAEAEGLAAVVAQCPFSDGRASVWKRFLAGPPSSAVLFVAGLLDLVGGLLRRPPLLLPMAGTPWMPSFLAAPDSLPGAVTQAEPGTVLSVRTSRALRRFPSVRRKIGEALASSDRPVPYGRDSIWGALITPGGAVILNAIAARLAVKLALYRPGRALRRTGTTPVLVCVCDGDTVAPPGPTLRAAQGLPNVTVNRYPYGHFEIYVGDAFEVAVRDQTAFLQAHLATVPSADVGAA